MALENDVVILSCADPDQALGRSFRWQQIDGTHVTLDDAHSANPEFIMPPGTPESTPREFECIVQNDATLCERADRTTVSHSDPGP